MDDKHDQKGLRLQLAESLQMQEVLDNLEELASSSMAYYWSDQYEIIPTYEGEEQQHPQWLQ